MPGASALQPREAEHQLVAALALGERMDFVDDDPGDPGEDSRRLRVGQHQRQQLRRRQQDVRRVDPLPRPLRRAGVPGPVLDPDGQAHLGQRRCAGCARCPPPAPSAARHRACAAPAPAPPRARPGSAGTRRASCRRRSARSAASPARPPAPAAPAGADAAPSPAGRTSRRKARAAGSRPRRTSQEQVAPPPPPVKPGA